MCLWFIYSTAANSHIAPAGAASLWGTTLPWIIAENPMNYVESYNISAAKWKQQFMTSDVTRIPIED